MLGKLAHLSFDKKVVESACFPAAVMDPNNPQHAKQWIAKARKTITKYTDGHKFFNLLDCDAEGDLWKVYFGSSAGRLLGLKRKWDPKNRLHVFCRKGAKI